MFLRQRSSVSNQPSTSDINLARPRPRPRPPQSALSQALESSANLAKLLPTGTLLAFQLLTPLFTNNGLCDSVTQSTTLVLLIILALSCFLASFTDSIKSSDGQVHYGVVTLKGLWLFGKSTYSGVPELGLNFIDVVHAVLSVLVFVAVALRDHNVVTCFYPRAGHGTQAVVNIAPIGIGVICSLLFVAFPSKRHGFGYPVTH